MKIKKSILIPSIVGVVAFIVGFFIGDSTAINKVNKQISSNVSANLGKKDDSKKEVPKQAEKSKEIAPIAFNQNSDAGNWNIKVLEASEKDVIKARDKYDHDITTDGKFLILKLELKNIKTAPVQYGNNDFALKDKKTNAVYQCGDNGFKVIQQLNATETIYNKNTSFIGIYDNVNPGMTKNTYIAFELPKDASIDNLVLGCLNDGNRNAPVFFNLK